MAAIVRRSTDRMANCLVATVMSLLLVPNWSPGVGAQTPAPAPQGDPYMFFVIAPDLSNVVPGKPLTWRIQIRQRYSDGTEQIVTGQYETYWYVYDKSKNPPLFYRSLNTNEFTFTFSREGNFSIQVALVRPKETRAFRVEGFDITVRKQTPIPPAASPNWRQDMGNWWLGFKITFDAATKSRMTPAQQAAAAKYEARTFCAKMVWNTNNTFNLVIYYPGGSPRTERWPIHAGGVMYPGNMALVNWYQDADPPRQRNTGDARLSLAPGRIEGKYRGPHTAGVWSVYQTTTPISQPCPE
jgi:hypothetical protein